MASLVSKIMGFVFLAVGVAGFVTGHSGQLIIFGINTPHNIVHLLSGALALAAGFSSEKNAKLYCLVFGAVYGLVTVLGFIHMAFAVQLLNLNMPDNLLHLAITVVVLGAGLSSKPQAA